MLADPLTLDRNELFRRPLIVSALAILHVGLGCLEILIGGLLMLTAGRMLAAPVIVLLLIGIGVGHVACGRGLWSLQPAGRTGALAFAVLWLVAFPIGSFLGVMVLVYLTRQPQRLLFSGRQPETMAAEDLALLHASGHAGSSAGAAAVLVAVAVVLFLALPMTGIMVAIAVPSLINAGDRGRCRRTVADLRMISDSLETHREELGTLPDDIDSIEALESVLGSSFGTPQTDGWDRPYVVEVNMRGYRLVSLGRDGQPGPEPPDGSYDTDIILEDGVVVQAPDGISSTGVGPSPPSTDTSGL